MPLILFWGSIFFHHGLPLATVQRLLSIPDMTIALSLLHNKDHSTGLRGKKNRKENEEWKILWSNKQRKISQCTPCWAGCWGRTAFLRTERIRYRNDSWVQGNTQILQKYPKAGSICDLFSLISFIALFPSSCAEGDLLLGAEQTEMVMQGQHCRTQEPLLTLCPQAGRKQNSHQKLWFVRTGSTCAGEQKCFPLALLTQCWVQPHLPPWVSFLLDASCCSPSP